MRLPEAKIKEAILHPERLVRQHAVEYFSKSHHPDPTIMPLAIQAIQTFGREQAFVYTHVLEDLAQSESTVDWAIRELARTEKLEEEEDYRASLSRLLRDADPTLLVPHAQDIVSAPGFTRDLIPAFEERLHLLGWDADRCWAELERLCAEGMKPTADFDFARGGRLVEALARHGTQYADRVLELLNYEVTDFENDPMTWMEIMMVMLAGRMRLERAIPQIVRRVGNEGDFLAEESSAALARIGTDEVALALTEGWSSRSWDYKLFATGPLESIHSDTTVRKCLELLPQEEDLGIKDNLAAALLWQFSTDAVDPVLHIVRQRDYEPQNADLKSMLVTSSTIMGVTFPEYKAWKREVELKQEESDRRIKEFNTWLSQPPPAPALAAPPPPDFSRPAPILRLEKPVGRNDPCPCGSGKKFKKCCMTKEKR